MIGHEESGLLRSVTGRRADLVQRLPVPAGRSQLRGLAVLPVSAESAHG